MILIKNINKIRDLVFDTCSKLKAKTTYINNYKKLKSYKSDDTAKSNRSNSEVEVIKTTNINEKEINNVSVEENKIENDNEIRNIYTYNFQEVKKFVEKNLTKENILFYCPKLQPKEIVKECNSCRKSFGFCRFKYNCRICGDVYCYYCCSNIDKFFPFYNETILVCDCCYKDKKYVM